MLEKETILLSHGEMKEHYQANNKAQTAGNNGNFLHGEIDFCVASVRMKIDQM